MHAESSRREFVTVWPNSDYGVFPSVNLKNAALQIEGGAGRGGEGGLFQQGFYLLRKYFTLTSTPHNNSFFIITNVLSLSRDLSHPFRLFISIQIYTTL